MATKDNIYYIHTTHTIIDYIDDLSRRYLPNAKIYHILDESILLDIRGGNTKLAEAKLTNIVDGAVQSGALQIMITCTSTGRLIDNLPAKHQQIIARVEEPSINKLRQSGINTAIVYTNPTVWPEIEYTLKSLNVSKSIFTPYYVDHAYESLLSGDILTHDNLIKSAIEICSKDYDQILLSQVSICNAMRRIGGVNDSANLLSLSDEAIMSLS